MRETPFSNCEREFLLQSIAQKKRLDGRETYDYRRIRISFGVDRGCCSVELGETRVMVQVSCEIVSPNQMRPHEGSLFVNVELSPMAAPHFEAGRQSEQGTLLTRILERLIKESRCVDMESLCVMAGEKVWQVRIDVHVLNHDGNLVDCSSIASMAALSHFRRPDVTVSGDKVIIHTVEEKDPIPLSVHHIPLCVTFVFFHQGKYLLVDPDDKEEKVMDGQMVIGMNKHREICMMQMTGNMLLLKDQVLRCSNVAVVKVLEMTELITKALDNDAKARASGEKFGFAASVETGKLTASQKQALLFDIANTSEEAENSDEVSEGESKSSMSPELVKDVSILGTGTAGIGTGGESTWLVDVSDDEADWQTAKSEKSASTLKPTSGKFNAKVTEETYTLGSDSEEEDTVTLNQPDLQTTRDSSGGARPKKKKVPTATLR